MRDVSVLIVAAGASARMGGGVPKPYRLLQGKAVLCHSVERFLAHPRVASVRVVMNPAHRADYDRAILGLTLDEPVNGGDTRQQSVANGLAALNPNPTPYVLIHDAARPGIDEATITRVIDALATHKAAIPAIAVVDTIKQVQGGEVTATPDRASLMAVQTPQGFHYDAICTAHAQGSDGATDDAALAEQAGIAVAVVEGSLHNQKLTTQEDWIRMQPTQTRVGMGFDVHVLYEDASRPLMIGGIEIPSPLALKAHSDGDVVLHALTDAILGALAAGDIGEHFPPSDPQWKDKNSAHFLQHVVQMVAQQNGQISHLDVTVICEKPKLSAHRDAMRERIAALCELSLSAVSVKATTTEKLGFTGRGEGIAAQAVVTITLSA